MENTYNNQKIGKKLKDGFRKAVIAYAVLGSFAMSPYTGHRSADIYLGLSKVSRLEKVILKPLCDKLNIKTDLLDK